MENPEIRDGDGRRWTEMDGVVHEHNTPAQPMKAVRWEGKVLDVARRHLGLTQPQSNGGQAYPESSMKGDNQHNLLNTPRASGSPFLAPEPIADDATLNEQSAQGGTPDNSVYEPLNRPLPPEDETEEERLARYQREWDEGRDPPPTEEPVNEQPANEQPPEPLPAIPRGVLKGRGTKKNMKASIKVSALNIRGHGNTNVNHDDNKWHKLWTIMRMKKIGAMIVGEAHLDEDRKAAIDSLFQRQLRVDYTKHPHTANAKGVAIVLNKNLVRTRTVKTYEIDGGL
ncbi:hypothetical protein C8R45DRAFT_1102307 [Mycena sanguinolenta]|nr:hypothetical protein C8R45DRAFT_1102307 [Mycena sanguinolenta]